MFSNNKQNQKSYIYEIRLPEKLMYDIKDFIDKYKENFELCIQKTLAIGLSMRHENKEKQMREKTLEETEEDFNLEKEVNLHDYSLPMGTLLWLQTSAMLHYEDVDSHFHQFVIEGLKKVTPVDEYGVPL